MDSDSDSDACTLHINESAHPLLSASLRPYNHEKRRMVLSERGEIESDIDQEQQAPQSIEAGPMLSVRVTWALGALAPIAALFCFIFVHRGNPCDNVGGAVSWAILLNGLVSNLTTFACWAIPNPHLKALIAHLALVLGSFLSLVTFHSCRR